VDLLDYSRAPAPAGELRFPLSGLRTQAGVAVWNGYVAYGGARRFPLWVKLKVAGSMPRLVAAAPLQPGRAIAGDQLRLERPSNARESLAAPVSMEDVIGKAPRRFIAKGTAIRQEWLEEPKAVVRGDVVVVEARAGAARLEMHALAEASGSPGDTVPVVNPQSKKRFQARVEGPGKVSVEWKAP
jgi:flagellar basal body P-ring formation protein FlgA